MTNGIVRGNCTKCSRVQSEPPMMGDVPLSSEKPWHETNFCKRVRGINREPMDSARSLLKFEQANLFHCTHFRDIFIQLFRVVMRQYQNAHSREKVNCQFNL